MIIRTIWGSILWSLVYNSYKLCFVRTFGRRWLSINGTNFCRLKLFLTTSTQRVKNVIHHRESDQVLYIIPRTHGITALTSYRTTALRLALHRTLISHDSCHSTQIFNSEHMHFNEGSYTDISWLDQNGWNACVHSWKSECWAMSHEIWVFYVRPA